MENIIWGLPIIVAILTFFGGRAYERHKIGQENRLKLLEPIEEWIQRLIRLTNFTEGELSVIERGYRGITAYEKPEMIETVKYLDENKHNIVGIINSKALYTRSIKKEYTKLTDKFNNIDILTQQLAPKLTKINTNTNAGINNDVDINELKQLISDINSITEQMIGYISLFKTKYN